MQIFGKETREVDVVIQTLCNKCGLSCVGKDAESAYGPYGLIEVEVMGGWFSPVLEDGQAYKFSLCEACLVILFKSFKLPAEDPSRSLWRSELIR